MFFSCSDIFMQESADWDPLDCDDLKMPRSGAAWKAKGNSKKLPRKKTAADIEELKKTAAVECLLSVSEEVRRVIFFTMKLNISFLPKNIMLF